MEVSLKGDGFIAGVAALLKAEVAPEGTIDDQVCEEIGPVEATMCRDD